MDESCTICVSKDALLLLEESSEPEALVNAVLPEAALQKETVPEERACRNGVRLNSIDRRMSILMISPYSQLDFPTSATVAYQIATAAAINIAGHGGSYLTGHAYYPDELATIRELRREQRPAFEYGAVAVEAPIRKADTSEIFRCIEKRGCGVFS